MESYGERWIRGWQWAGETPESGEEKRQSEWSIPQKGRGSPQTNYFTVEFGTSPMWFRW